MMEATQQDDIDAVPLLAVLQAAQSAEADTLWRRAVQYERSILSDPDFAEVTQRDLYMEVGRRLEEHLGSDGVAHWLEEPETAEQPSELDRLAALPMADLEAQIDAAGIDALVPDDGPPRSESLRELEAAMDQAASEGQLDSFLSNALAG
jgi:hypothetical protein